ncbi:hypothetical protein GGTG_04307 [Gaeumannomyces tritici R3-111a-1]|uniref:F-box domain-containing protein n=1 Tax=Gaeumannomyces tritici (strain R3-111a-1) TaxID=644352 RepID=J3NSQ8_GAET3|nr:hypothetical protein GGTG_04307 [Gaeumannomyces tritici R3-111a-1]EJT79221.1 hypothetical protein GGTG_04307 [Gaeumannomyces tritici R3-111a-1]
MAAVSTMSTSVDGSHLFPWGDLGGTTNLLPSSSLTAILSFVVGTCSSCPGLETLPGELILEIFKDLDVVSAVILATTCKRLRQLFINHRSHIVLSILPSDPEISPVDGLFQVAAMDPGDLSIPWGTWLYKEVWFRRKLLCPGGQLPVWVCEGRNPQRAKFKTNADEAVLPLGVACLGEADIDRLLEISKVARGWERIFPRFRFWQHPEHARRLRPHEAVRLRRALYHWMRYDYYFHGDRLPPPGPLEPFGSDERCNFVRMLDSGEASELADLWITVKAAAASLCPSLTAVRLDVESSVTEEQLTGVAWGATDHEHSMSVSTMLKLGPERLLYYIEHAHDYSKARLVDEICRQRPSIESDTESLTTAISVVYRERYDHCLSHEAPVPPSPFSSPREPFGGILDWGEEELESLRGSVMAGFGLRWLAEDEEDEDEEDAEEDEEESEDQEEVAGEEGDAHGMLAGGLGF